jgi:hypothetical protein
MGYDQKGVFAMQSLLMLQFLSFIYVTSITFFTFLQWIPQALPSAAQNVCIMYLLQQLLTM